MGVSGDVVELRRRLIVLRGPGLSAIHADGGTAVIAIDEPIGIGGIDPEAVMIAMWSGKQIERLAAIARAESTRIQNVDSVRGFRVGEDVREVPCALAI